MPRLEMTHEAMRHYYRGRVFESTGEIDISIEEYKKSVELGADYADIHNSLGRVYAKKGLFDEARQSFQKALHINPHYLEAQRNLSELETRLSVMHSAPQKDKKRDRGPEVPAEESPPGRSLWMSKTAFILVGLLTGIIITGVALFLIPRLKVQEKIVTFTAPSDNIIALVRDGDTMYMYDWLKQEIYNVAIREEILAVRKTYRFTDVFPVGLAAGKSYLWSIDAWAKKINKHIYDDKFSVLYRYDSPGKNPAAICWDGKNLWSVDGSSKKIYRHNTEDPLLAPEQEFNSPCSRPVGFFYDGKAYLSVDGDGQVVYKHTANMETVANYRLNFPGKKMSGIFIDRKYVWVSFEGDPTIIRYPKDKLLQ
ncbi:MAG: tetratricopeptide repeat protein [Elusimicrobia bacterium]|nr:tetratricopeptide repeat protein [Elusimicrobiota bacterium]